jgi:hypothetical protein
MKIKEAIWRHNSENHALKTHWRKKLVSYNCLHPLTPYKNALKPTTHSVSCGVCFSGFLGSLRAKIWPEIQHPHSHETVATICTSVMTLTISRSVLLFLCYTTISHWHARKTGICFISARSQCKSPPTNGRVQQCIIQGCWSSSDCMSMTSHPVLLEI